MTEEDMKRLIKKEKDTAEAMEHLNAVFGAFGKLSSRAYLFNGCVDRE